jgi:hypothetical protein
MKPKTDYAGSMPTIPPSMPGMDERAEEESESKRGYSGEMGTDNPTNRKPFGNAGKTDSTFGWKE